MISYDERDEYECPAPKRLGRVARIVNRALGTGLANVWLALLMGTARVAHVLTGRRRTAELARPSLAATRDARAPGDLGDELAVARARRAYG